MKESSSTVSRAMGPKVNDKQVGFRDEIED